MQTFLVCAALLTFPPSLAIAQRAELLRRLRDEQELTNSTLETAAAIIVMTDPDGIVLRANETTTRLTGFSAERPGGPPVLGDADHPGGAHRAIVRDMFGRTDGVHAWSPRARPT